MTTPPKPLSPEMQRQMEELSKLEADYFSDIQFPPTWVEINKDGLKQDVNAGRRKRCADDHSWGYQKGFTKGAELQREEMQEVVDEERRNVNMLLGILKMTHGKVKGDKLIAAFKASEKI